MPKPISVVHHVFFDMEHCKALFARDTGDYGGVFEIVVAGDDHVPSFRDLDGSLVFLMFIGIPARRDGEDRCPRAVRLRPCMKAHAARGRLPSGWLWGFSRYAGRTCRKPETSVQFS